MTRPLLLLAAAAMTIGVVVGMTRAASPGEGSAAATATTFELPGISAGRVARPATERHHAIEQADAPISLGKIKFTIDMSPAAVQARSETQDVVCPGQLPCGP